MFKFIKISTIILFVSTLSSVCFAQSGAEGSAIVADQSGNVYVGGFSASTNAGTDMCTLKYNSNGDTLWMRIYNGGYIDNKAYAITIDKQWNIIVTGYTQTASGRRITTLKYDSLGNLIWAVKYPDTTYGDSKAYAITIDSYDNIYISGFATSNVNGTDYVTIKYDSSGVQQWVTSYDGTGNSTDTATSITMVSDNYVAVTGCSMNSSQNLDIVTIQYNTSTGTQQWLSRYDGPGNGDDKGNAITADANNNVYITGYSTGIGTGKDITTIKYDPNGVILWVKRKNVYGYDDIGNSIGLTSTNDVVVTGSTASSSLITSNNYITIKYHNYSGYTAWSKQYNGPGNSTDIARKLVISQTDNTIYVTGSSKNDTSSASEDIFTIAYNDYGDTLGTVRDSVSNSATVGKDITIAPSGNVLVTGFTIPLGGNTVVRSKIYTANLGKLGKHPTAVSRPPSSFNLYQNYPNPFNPSTIIKFVISKAANVKLVVYDILGRAVQTLVDNNLIAGSYSISFNKPGLASGVYFYELIAGDFRDIKKMIILK